MSWRGGQSRQLDLRSGKQAERGITPTSAAAQGDSCRQVRCWEDGEAAQWLLCRPAESGQVVIAWLGRTSLKSTQAMSLVWREAKGV